MKFRWIARISAVLTAVLLPIAVGAGTAFASFHPDDGEPHGPSLGAGMTVLLFVVIPLGVFAVIAGLALLPSALRRPRYRPGKAWNHDPMWFRGPDDPDSALRDARPGGTARGGTSAEY